MPAWAPRASANAERSSVLRMTYGPYLQFKRYNAARVLFVRCRLSQSRLTPRRRRGIDDRKGERPAYAVMSFGGFHALLPPRA